MKCRKLNHERLIPLLLLYAFLLITPAMGADICRIVIPVSVKDSGAAPDERENHAIRLDSLEVGEPMPEGTENGSYTLQIAGSGAGELILMYEAAGEYGYNISQNKGIHDNCVYDSTSYRLQVTIIPDDQGSMKSSVVLYQEGKTEKRSEAAFVNTYAPPKNDEYYYETEDGTTGTPDETETGGNTENTEDTEFTEEETSNEESYDEKEEDEPEKKPSQNSGGGSSGGSGSGTSLKGDSGKGDSVKTGDASPIDLWMLVMAGSFLAILVISGLRKRNAADTSEVGP